MSTVKSKKLQVGTDATSSNNFTIYQPATPDGTLRIGVGNADSPTEVGQFNANGYKPQQPVIAQAKRSATQTISASTWTAVQLDETNIDTDTAFDTSTYKFQPTVAGYYWVAGHIMRTTSTGQMAVGLWKNGSKATQGDYGANDMYGGNCVHIIHLNGSTDYVQLMMYATTSLTISGGNNTFLNAYLIAQT